MPKFSVQIRFSRAITCSLILSLAPSHCFGSSPTVKVCQLPANGMSITQVPPPPSDSSIYVSRVPGNPGEVEGIIHTNLRNDGPTEIDHLCAGSIVSDIEDRTRQVSLALSRSGQDPAAAQFKPVSSCLEIQPSWKPFEDVAFDVHVRADSSIIPVLGSINFETTSTSREKAPAEVVTGCTKIPKECGDGSQPADSSHDCTAASKPVLRPFALLPSRHSCWLWIPISSAFLSGFGYLWVSLGKFSKDLSRPMGGPQWSFGTSFASNFTVGTGLLTLLLSGNVISDALHYLTKLHYTMLGILFAALLLLAPAMFLFFSSPRPITTSSGQTAMIPVGTVGLFLATSALMIGAVTGQLSTVGLAVAEIQFRGFIGYLLTVPIICLLLTAAVGTTVCATKTVGSNLQQQSNQEKVVQSIRRKLADMKQIVPPNLTDENVLTAAEHDTLSGLIDKKKPDVPKWNMF